MWNRKRSVSLSLAACLVFLVILTAGLFFGPWAIKAWFSAFRGWEEDGAAMARILKLTMACYYPCAVFAYVTLYSLLRLLWNIKKDAIFVTPNVKYLRCISWCCFAVAFITLLGGTQYLPFLFMTIAAAFVGLMLRVVKNVMESAVAIKAENELTI